MEEDIQNIKQFKNIDEAIKVYEEFRRFKNDGFISTIDPDFFFNLMDYILKRYKELEEENNIITTGRRNGKTIELAMKLREEILKLPECRLYGIKNCKNKIVLLIKEECIPTSIIQKKMDDLDKEKLKYHNDLRIYTLRNTFDFQKEILQEILEEGRR